MIDHAQPKFGDVAYLTTIVFLESMLYYYFLEIRLKPRAVIPPAITVSMIRKFYPN